MNRLLLFVPVFCFASCEVRYTTLSGKTMGTYYSIEYKGSTQLNTAIDSILNYFISAASTYDSTSEISEFNRDGSLVFRSPHLYRMLTMARSLHQQTDGAFEPTLMPLIKAYGFTGSQAASIPSNHRDSLLKLVSFDHINFDREHMYTLKKGVQLDLSAMGEGYAIDMLAEFLESKDIHNYKVEIGGEMKCKGRNSRNKPWLIGIENPAVPGSAGKILSTIELNDEALSTSGSYRKFFTDHSGKKRSHILDPRTGESVVHDMLSVTVKSKNAVTADAMATACMVLGKDAAIKVLQNAGLEALITFEENGKILTWQSKGFFTGAHDRSLMLR